VSTETARQAPAYYVLIRQDTAGGTWYWKVLAGGVCRYDGDAATWAEANRAVEQIMGRLLMEEGKL
jgi:hypothetical protein